MTVNLGPALLGSPDMSRVETRSAGAAPVPRFDVLGAADFDDIVDEWGTQSFPASDPPSNW